MRIQSTVVLRSLLGSCALAAIAVPTLASAQDTGTAAGTASATAQSAQGESDQNTIIVTAQRRSEALETVPMSVSVVTAQTLATAGVTSLRDIANVTSGFSVGAGGAFPQPAIRGVTTIINGTFENNVAVYVDGLYEPVAQAINIDLPNVESVQILKGPQGTLYGRNATGGAILLTTINPTNEWRGKAELTYARFNDKRASGYVAGPLAPGLGISVAGYIRRSDGYDRLASRTTPGATSCCAVPVDQDSIRVKLRGDLSDNFHATLQYNYTHINDARSNVYTPYENVAASYARPGGATLPKVLGVQAYDIGDFMETKQHEGGLTLELDTGIGTLKSITGYGQVTTYNAFDFDGSYIPASYSINHLRERTFQDSLDYNITAIEHVDLILGANYFHDIVEFPEAGLNYSGTNQNSAGTTPGSLADYIVLTQSYFHETKAAWAVYGDLTFHATDQLSLNVGGRYSSETQHVFGQVVAASPLAAASTRNPTNVQASFHRFTPRASIRYEIAPRTDVYASYSQGFRSGAFNTALPACVNTQPSCWLPALQETISAYEVGFKSAGRNFHVELAGFYYDYKNLQVSATRTDIINGQSFPRVDVTNAPKAKIYGADVSFDWQPIENLTIRGSGTWLHARYGSGFIFFGTGVAASGPGGGVGINVNSDPLKTYLNISQAQDLSNLQMARAPDFSGNIGFDYLVPMGKGGVRFGANLKYTTKYVATNPSVWGPNPGVPVDRQSEQRFTIPAYALLNASVTWTDPTDHYYVRVWGTNLTNHKYRLHYSGTASGTYSPMAEPLVYGATVGYKF